MGRKVYYCTYFIKRIRKTIPGYANLEDENVYLGSGLRHKWYTLLLDKVMEISGFFIKWLFPMYHFISFKITPYIKICFLQKYRKGGFLQETCVMNTLLYLACMGLQRLLTIPSIHSLLPSKREALHFRWTHSCSAGDAMLLVLGMAIWVSPHHLDNAQ